MEHTAAQPVYHSEPLYVPQTQHEPQVQYRAVVDRHGQHILPEDRSGTWARFSEQNAAALEILRTDPPMQRHTDAEPAMGYLDMWLSRDHATTRGPAGPGQQPTDRGVYPFPEPAPEPGHPQQHQQVYYTLDAPDQHPVHQPGPPQVHGERAPWHDAHPEQAPEQGPEPSGWGQAGVFPFTGGWEVVAAQQEHQAPPRQPRGRRRRPRTHKGELATVIPNIPTIPPPDQRDTASPDVLVCAYICMSGTTGDSGDLPNTCLASFSTVNSRNGQPGTDRVDRTVTARWQAGRKDFAPQTCTPMTGVAGTYSAGTLATAYLAAVYLPGYTGVGAFLAPGDARHADQQQTAQDSQTGMSYMAPTRPSTARGQTDRQRFVKATGRESVPACRPCMWMAGATGTYPAGPLASAYSPTLHNGVGALVVPGDAQSADQRHAAHNNQTGMSYMASNRPSARRNAAQVPTDGHRTGQASGTVTRIHAFPGSDLLVLLPQYREELPYPSGHPPPLMRKELPYDPPSRQTLPNNRRHSPALTRVLRDRTADGDIEKNPGPEDAQTTENDIPPRHREMVTRLASEFETASNPHYPAKLYKYATQALPEALQRKQRASTTPLGHSTPAPRAESSSTHGTLVVPSPEASSVHGAHDQGTPRPPSGTSELTVKTQKHHSPLGLNITTAIDVVCPRCNMADFVYFRCTTCKYFAIHQPDTPDLVPRRLYNVMSPHPLYPRQESWQEAIPATTSQTCHTPAPHKTAPRPTAAGPLDGWIRDVTSDGDVEPNPGPSSSAPSAKRTRYNQDKPHTYQTPRMLRKPTADNTHPGHKRRRTDHVHMAN